ncbi:MAG: hypothetical protein PWK00_07570, partial [Coxiella burnetii]|nr:hypothetical protein [Coxiella burnetii]
ALDFLTSSQSSNTFTAFHLGLEGQVSENIPFFSTASLSAVFIVSTFFRIGPKYYDRRIRGLRTEAVLFLFLSRQASSSCVFRVR